MDHLDLVIISPKIRPLNDSLSDYTFYFLKEMRKNSPEKKIGLITSDNVQIIKMFKNDPLIFPIMKAWDGLELKNLILLILNKKPKKILIQYLPQTYGREGLNFLFSLHILFIRIFTNIKIEIMAHELYSPSHSILKNRLIYTFQHLNLFLLSLAAHNLFTTTENFVYILNQFPFKNNNITQLAVGSTIPRHLEKIPSYDNYINIVIFGTLHPNRDPDLLYSLIADYFILHNHSKIRFHIIGCLKSEILTIFHHKNIQINKNLIEKFIFHGNLNEFEVGKVFNSCQFSLNYYTDGISAKCGSAIAALNFGLSLISNHNELSDKLFLNQPNVTLLGSTSKEFSVNFKRFLENIEKNFLNNDSSEIKDASPFFNEYFSWDNIIKKYNHISNRN